MTQLEADRKKATGQGTSARHAATRLATAAFIWLGIVVLLGVVAAEGFTLFREWMMFQEEVREAKRHAVVGYYNIAPIATYARAPLQWYRDEGESSLLWAQWQAGQGHKWFRFNHGQIDPARIARPTPDYISRAIDYPLVEVGGGQIWNRIAPDSPVVGHTLEGKLCAYPVAVLGKVQVINDIVGDHPFLIVLNLFPNTHIPVSIFDAMLDGHRLTMAATGYFHDRKPMLYDRGTESLWVERRDGLTAIAGKHAGDRLPQVAQLVPTAWVSWQSQHPETRLLVGADRTQGVPAE